MPLSKRCGECDKPIKNHKRAVGMKGGLGGGKAMRVVAKLRAGLRKRPISKLELE